MNKNVSALFKFSIRDITEIAILAALAIVLDTFIRIPLGASGGSINISSIPLFIIAFRHGWFKGLIGAGIVYSVATCALDGYGFQYFFFDYFLAFGCIALGGLCSKYIYNFYYSNKVYLTIIAFSLVVLSFATWFVIRTLSASVDSMIFYGYTFGASLAYNIPYVGLSAIGSCVILCVLLPMLMAYNKQNPSTYLKANMKDDEEEQEENNTETDEF